MKNALKHWMTTLAGLVAAAGNLSVNGMTLKSFLISLAIASLGAAAKDANKS